MDQESRRQQAAYRADPVARAMQRARTPWVALPIFMVAAGIGAFVAWRLRPSPFEPGLLISGAATAVAILLWFVASWDLLSSLKIVREIAPLNPHWPALHWDRILPRCRWVQAILRWGRHRNITVPRLLPAPIFILGYFLGHWLWF